MHMLFERACPFIPAFGRLDPYKRLESNVAPVRVQVVALNWKWLIIYPDFGVASVNRLPIPVNTPIEFSLYAQIFTAHGVIMIFFVATPLIIGLMNVIVPLQIGARDVAFPFVNSLGAVLVRRLACLSLFWHFLDLIWICVFTFVYLREFV